MIFKGGCTSLVQPIDVCINKSFKAAVEKLATQHMQENLEAYVNSSVTASSRRLLFTKWIGQAWEEVSAKKDMIIRSFRKTGIAVAVDGSEDAEIHIEGLQNYTCMTDSDDSDDSDDPFNSDSDETAPEQDDESAQENQ